MKALIPVDDLIQQVMDVMYEYSSPAGRDGWTAAGLAKKIFGRSDVNACQIISKNLLRVRRGELNYPITAKFPEGSHRQLEYFLEDE